MLKSCLIAVFLAVFFPISVAYGQLGPKDGANLKPIDLGRVQVGNAAPDFTLENLDGERISLSDFRGKKNVLLVFYHGHW
jgi:cytochrome oxidase Cu insertion factor (SCO1/SenC/PrrC family)